MTAGVSCIIPAWNEQARIGAVLDAALGHPDLCEVIVVDDASDDQTAAVAAGRGARVLRQPRNGGKSAAVARGLAAARGDLILLLDADLIGLRPEHLTRLIAPVREGRADASLSLRANAPLAWRVIGLDYISGERVMPRALLTSRLEQIGALRGFGLEVFFNRIWIAQALRLAVVRLPLRSPRKAEKQGMLRGWANDLGMIRDIVTTIGAVEIMTQIRSLHRLARSHPPATAQSATATVTQHSRNRGVSDTSTR